MEYIITWKAKKEREKCKKSMRLKAKILAIGIKKQANNGRVNNKPPIAKDSKI